ncbi:LamG-like jellyroll fold domain-containing protein [Kineosporia sp. NBRC 101731]|uniref:LamG domain-containing protein n=1 Tax=Kineosporia sp. NBRC 101731 TaxID=3032199 RepID=UPI002552DADA|nr:LamG-like jellyroll fold domain-containing protein [Kineosporia sp. NBRC 101731]
MVLFVVICGVLTVLTAPGPSSRYLPAAFSSTTTSAGNSFAAASSFPTYPQVVRADGPSVYYRGDEADGSATAVDSSGNGTTGGYLSVVPSFQVPGGPAGGSGSGADTAVRFSGDSSTAASPSLTVPTAFTYEIWFRTTSTAVSRIIGFGSASSGYSATVDRYVSLTTGGALSLTVGSSTVTSTVTGLNDGAWHLLGASLGAAGMRLYADGVEVAADAATTTGTAFTGYLRMGGDGAYFVGTLDESVLYLKQLTAARMSAHHAAATSLTSWTSALTTDSPWAVYHLNDAPDASYKGINFPTRLLDAGTGNRRGWYYYVRPIGMKGGVPGALGGPEASSTAMRFTGAGIGYDPVQISNPTTFSLELWFRTSSTTGGDLISFGNTMTGDSSTYDRIWKMMDDGTVTFGIYVSGNIVSATSTASYNDGAWHHGVLTLSPADGMVLYIDGTVAATNPSPGSPQNYSGYWRWGGGKKWVTPPASEFFFGDLDEVAVYPVRLTAAQVARHYWSRD